HQTEDSYQVFNMEALAEGIGQITGIMTAIIGSIAGISLLVGGIGVMNIMLVSVTERTREIGIRMAVGATRGQIMFQFLVEAMTLTLIGGIIGILLGWGAASLVSLFAGWPSLVSWYVVVGAVLFSMLIGVIFGLLPANKASRLDPIESLRYE
ncbi:MAG: FtsX-like permease family protein, partial [Novibacillus thermophilus]